MHKPAKRVSYQGSVAPAELLGQLNERRYSQDIEDLLDKITEVNRLDVIHRATDSHWIRTSPEISTMLRLQKSIKELVLLYPMIPMLRIGPDGWLHTFDLP